MAKYRVLKIGNKFYPQKKMFFGMFWGNFKYVDCADELFDTFYSNKEEAIRFIETTIKYESAPKALELKEVVWQYPENDELMEGFTRCCKNPPPDVDKPEPPKGPTANHLVDAFFQWKKNHGN